MDGDVRKTKLSKKDNNSLKAVDESGASYEQVGDGIHKDYYGDPVGEGGQYCIVHDFYDNPVMINVLDGNKDMFIRNNLKATEYITFLNETFEEAQEANAGKAAVKIDLGRIEYKIDTLFGYNDGTASRAKRFSYDVLS